MADRMCAAPLVRRSEFVILTDPISHTTVRRFGTCGETADNSALASALGHEPGIQAVYNAARNAGADEGGASTFGENIAACNSFGAAVIEYSGFHNPWDWATCEDFIRRRAGIDPIVPETSKGQALVDSISGQGENAVNLQFHYPAFLGYHAGGASDFAGGKVLPEGVWAADGCNFAGGNYDANGFNAADVLQFYPMSVVQAAALVGMLALKGRDTMLQLATPPVGSYFAANADGSWHCKPTNVTLRGGMLTDFQTFVGTGNLNGLSDFGLPLTNEIPIGAASSDGIQPTIQIFERKARIYDPHRVIDNPPGETGNIYSAHLNRPEVLAALGAVLKSSIPPAPVPTPPVVSFGAATVATLTESGDVKLTVTLPFSAK